MLARLATTALVGLAAYPVGVEVDIGRGLPAVTVVGLGDTAVLQARDRIRAAFGNAGFDWPDRRVTVSLPPSDLPKHGPGFDLPIAIGLLAAGGIVPVAALDGLWAVGELGLGGDLRGVRGVLATALAARRAGARLLLVPCDNLAEAALVPGCGSPAPARWGRWGSGCAAAARSTRRGGPARWRPARSRRRTSPTCAASRSPAGRSRWPPPAATTCCWWARQAPARRCWPGACPASSRSWSATRRSR
jgi:Mg-chelatase subunit ChlI-like protein